MGVPTILFNTSLYAERSKDGRDAHPYPLRDTGTTHYFLNLTHMRKATLLRDCLNDLFTLQLGNYCAHELFS